MLLYQLNCLSLVKLLISWTLIIGGWFVVHIATLRRERRKEKREAINIVLKEIRDIENTAIEFHNSKDFNKKVADDLTLKIRRLAQKLQIPPLSDLGVPLGLMVEFRKTITLKHFDKSDFPSKIQRIMKGDPYPATSIDALIEDINFATDELIDFIEAAKNTMFP